MKRSVSVILVGSDLTKQSRRALELGAELARATGSSLVVGHAVELPARLRSWSPVTRRSDRDVYRALLEGQVAGAQATLERVVAAELPGTRARSVARAGPAGEVLVEIADEVEADLVIIARGAGGRLGGTAERLARLSGRAVLIAPVPVPSRPFVIQGGRAPKRATRPRARAARGG